VSEYPSVCLSISRSCLYSCMHTYAQTSLFIHTYIHTNQSIFIVSFRQVTVSPAATHTHIYTHTHTYTPVNVQDIDKIAMPDPATAGRRATQVCLCIYVCIYVSMYMRNTGMFMHLCMYLCIYVCAQHRYVYVSMYDVGFRKSWT
jgi:hypothetical protein